MLTPGRHRVELDGVTQAYEVAGAGPVCFVHSGGPGIDSDYLRMPSLERDLTMVYLDPIGTGQSGFLPGGHYSVREYARRVELLREHLGVTDGFLFGHSHGGFVALEYGLDFPGRMRGLIAYDTTPTNGPDLEAEAGRQMASFAERWPDRPEVLAAIDAISREEEKIHDAASFTDYMAVILPLYFADWRATVKKLGAPPQTIITAYDPDRKAPGSPWDVRGKLAGIQDPTLVLVGTYDFICPPVWALQIDAEVPDSRLVEFTGSGHFAHLEEPEEFVKAVTEFVGSR
jgi:pimeloyl-ACP methyl ester carboxylesterase